MAAPITPNVENTSGRMVVVIAPYTAGGATTRIVVTIPTYAPKIDIREAHPIIYMCAISTETNGTGSENFLPENEMARGTDADSQGEWDLLTISTVGAYITTDQNGLMIMCYKAYGAQEA